MKKLDKFSRGMGIGGWLTNYKRFNVLPNERRMIITVGDMEHFESYITERDIEYIASLGMDHIRLGFDQIVIEKAPYEYRTEIIDILHRFVDWCHKYDLGIVLNMHKALGNYCDILEERGLMTQAAVEMMMEYLSNLPKYSLSTAFSSSVPSRINSTVLVVAEY